MTKNVFSVPIFFIVFRETLEAAIIISVLLGLAEQIVTGSDRLTERSENDATRKRALLKKLRLQIAFGAGLGLLIALAIGAAFIAVWFTKASDLWLKSEELWEGIFNLIACLLIFLMGLSMLKMDRAKAKWRAKLQRAFESGVQGRDKQSRSGKWALFILPFITVLREGLEAVVFVGGVSLGQPATSIPLAAIIGIICGLACGFLIYEFASRTSNTALMIFMVAMTNFLLLIGAGLFSKTVGSFERHAFNTLLGADVDDASGSGPGTYPVKGNVWHLDCCNPEDKNNGNGWMIFNAIFGWSNNGSMGTILAYVFYWLAVVGALVHMKFSEGRTTIFGWESAAGKRRRFAEEGSKTPSEENCEAKAGLQA